LNVIPKQTKKNDINAFAMICWEVLSREKPFQLIKTDAALCAKIHSNVRPDMESLPKELQASLLIDMIKSCWHTNRVERKSAAECFSILNHYYLLLSKNKYDIFFSHAWKDKSFLSHVHDYLIRKGYQVWYDQTEMGHDIKESMRNGLINSKVVLVCLSSVYQTINLNCAKLLR
jgi:hypothetical protein